jgi:phosphonate transport system substrate-binding protein
VVAAFERRRRRAGPSDERHYRGPGPGQQAAVPAGAGDNPRRRCDDHRPAGDSGAAIRAVSGRMPALGRWHALAPRSAVMRYPVALLAVVLLAALPAGAGAQSAPPAATPLTFGVLNQQSPALTAERWNPILHHVGNKSGVGLRLRMGRTVDETNAMMARGEFDFVFTNHNFQSEFDQIGFKVIARWGGDPIRAVIAVPEESAIRRLRELDGKRVSFPTRDAFVGYAVPTVALQKAGVTVEPVFGGNQEGSLAQLKARRVEAAAVNSRFLVQYAEREGMRFREIFVSEGYPDLAVIAHPRVPAPVVDRVRRALLEMRTDPEAADILARGRFKGFEPAADSDYDGVRHVYRQIGQ